MNLAKIGNKTLWRVLAGLFAFILIISIAGDVVTREWSGYINKYLGVEGTKIVEKGDGNVDTVYFKSAFSNYKDVMENARNVSRQVQADGTILLRNENNALPLSKGAKVTVFSYSSADLAYGGTGSGGVTASAERKYDLRKSFAEDGRLVLNDALYDYYLSQIEAGNQAKDGALTRKKGGGSGSGGGGGEETPDTTPTYGNNYKIPEISPSEFPAEVTGSYANYADAAIFVMSRIGGEGADLTTKSANSDEDRYLDLSETEREVLQAMKDGPFSKRIVLINAFNAVELGWLDEYDIDAVLYIGGLGEVGMDSVVDILVGNVNPSGKLADTYAYDSYSSPAMQNFGGYTYTNADEINNSDSRKYLVYAEGIYVGYRYYETRYEDTVLKQGNASSTKGAFASEGAWNYTEEVQFPFGFGLSYTTFTQKLENVVVDENAKTATVTVSVKNTGSVAGKDVIEIYAQSPYTAGGIEKASVVLVGFVKTDELAANAEKTYEVVVDLNDVASYDYKTARTYVLEGGDYYFAIGNGAHEALNNILAAKGKTTADGMDANGNAANAYKWTKNGDTLYSESITGFTVTNQFDAVDLNHYGNLVTYLTRSDWDGTWPKEMVDFAATSQMVKEMNDLYDENNNPAAYTPGSSDISSITLGAQHSGVNIATMMGKDYDDEAWETLLDMLTIEEMANFARQGRPAIPSVGQPETTAVDGPAAWTKSTYKVKYDDFSADAEKTTENMVLYPTETVIASTWNVVLAREVGNSFGEEGLWGGGVGWYGPAANLHRTPYAGRNFEYYSEDGFISGELAEAEAQGAMAKGVIPYLKHFFLNDQETNRIGVCTFANEQSLREIYLKAYQAPFSTDGTEEDPAVTGVMGAFNRLGVTWSGHYGNLWHNVMAGEWGFTGNVTTDFGQKPQSLMEPQLAYEAGNTMFCTSGQSFTPIIAEKAAHDLKLLTNLREATHRILYNFTNSAAMNGMSSTVEIVAVNTWYNNALMACMIVSGLLTAVCGLMTVVHTFGTKKEEK